MAPHLLQQLWDLRAKGGSVRGIARVLGISRNTVRRYFRRAAGSAFPPPMVQEPAWQTRARSLFEANASSLGGRALAGLLRAEGLAISDRSAQRLVAVLRKENTVAQNDTAAEASSG